jgi:hypothetical protein
VLLLAEKQFGANMKKKKEDEKQPHVVRKSSYEPPSANFVARKKVERLQGCGDSETLCTQTYHQ